MTPIAKLGNPPDPARPRRRRRLRTVRTLPTLLTLGNLVCGFAAIHYCMSAIVTGETDLTVVQKLTLHSQLIESLLPSFVSVSAFMIVAGMLFDAADGRVARFTQRTSNFGGQLDSLADMVSFGVAPAVLMITLLTRLPDSDLVGLPGRAVWGVAAVYACCAAMRLARFNVEHAEDSTSGHTSFHGLPSPGAALVVASLVILHELLEPQLPRTANLLANVLPYMVLGSALLMVSNVRYVHVGNAYLRGRRPFDQFVIFLVVLGVLLWHPVLTMAGGSCLYAASGPIGWFLRRLRPRPQQASANPEAADPENPAETRKLG